MYSKFNKIKSLCEISIILKSNNFLMLFNISKGLSDFTKMNIRMTPLINWKSVAEISPD